MVEVTDSYQITEKAKEAETELNLLHAENEEKLKSGDIKDTIDVARSLFTRNKINALMAPISSPIIRLANMVSAYPAANGAKISPKFHP